MNKKGSKNVSKDEEQVPSFLRKTFDIIESGNYTSYIHWSQDGLSLFILNSAEFAERILPIYFKHNNITSFIRQLNMYEFKKKKSKFSDHIFTHEYFQRGRCDLLKFIKRKNTKPIPNLNRTNSDGSRTEGKEENELIAFREQVSLREENTALKKIQFESAERIRFLEKSLIEANQKSQEIQKQNSNTDNKSETLLKLILGQIACFYGPGAVQNIFQMIKRQTVEQGSALPSECQSYQSQHQSHHPTYMSQSVARPIYEPYSNNMETFSYYQEGHASDSQGGGYYRTSGSIEISNQYPQESYCANHENPRRYEQPLQFEPKTQYSTWVHQPSLSTNNMCDTRLASKPSSYTVFQQYQAYSTDPNLTLQDKNSFLSTEFSDEFKRFPGSS